MHITSPFLTPLRALLCALCVSAVIPANGQLVTDLPDELVDVGIDEKRGETLPLDLEFLDENGNRIKLREIFSGERPILLSLNYSNCPLLCRLQLNGLVDGIREMEWTTGEEFTIVSLSIDPNETPAIAKKTEEKYLRNYGRAGVGNGWYFLTGSEQNIKRLADSVGFRYKFIPESNDYSHAPAVIVCTPDGVVSRYLYGVLYEEQTVRLALVEAGEGKVGSAVDQLILYCFHYDETKGRYGPAAIQIMKVGAATTVLVLSAVLVPFWIRSRKSSANVPPTSTEPPGGESVSHPLSDQS
jgi:protein SCO1